MIAARSDVTTAEIGVGGVVDADAGRSAGVDELEAAGRGVDFGHNADVPNSVASTATAEENEVALAHLGHTGYGAASVYWLREERVRVRLFGDRRSW